MYHHASRPQPRNVIRSSRATTLTTSIVCALSALSACAPAAPGTAPEEEVKTTNSASSTSIGGQCSYGIDRGVEFHLASHDTFKQISWRTVGEGPIAVPTGDPVHWCGTAESDALLHLEPCGDERSDQTFRAYPQAIWNETGEVTIDPDGYWNIATSDGRCLTWHPRGLLGRRTPTLHLETCNESSDAQAFYFRGLGATQDYASISPKSDRDTELVFTRNNNNIPTYLRFISQDDTGIAPHTSSYLWDLDASAANQTCGAGCRRNNSCGDTNETWCAEIDADCVPLDSGKNICFHGDVDTQALCREDGYTWSPQVMGGGCISYICGDGECDPGESTASCAADCVPAPSSPEPPPPQYLTLSAYGFDTVEEPREVTGIRSGGNLNGRTAFHSGCAGYVGGSPDITLNYTADSTDLLRIFAVAAGADLTLIVRAPDGDYHCNDDTSSPTNRHPTVDITGPATGEYDIWVGSYHRFERHDSVVTIAGHTTYSPSVPIIHTLDPTSHCNSAANGLQFNTWGSGTFRFIPHSGALSYWDDRRAWAYHIIFNRGDEIVAQFGSSSAHFDSVADAFESVEGQSFDLAGTSISLRAWSADSRCDDNHSSEDPPFAFLVQRMSTISPSHRQ